jgi:DNA repair protein RecO (recombination protein O)
MMAKMPVPETRKKAAFLSFWTVQSKNPTVQTTPAIIIRLTRLTDTSLIVHWFTEHYGLVKTVAKGARRPKSPFAGKLDLFFGGEISIAQARQGDLHVLRETVILEWREGLRKSYTSTLLAAYFCQLLESAVEPEHPDTQLHNLLVRGLDHLNTTPATLRALEHFETELARMLGVEQKQHDAAISLRDALGYLPASRSELTERLSAGSDFSSHGQENRQ